MDHTQIVVPASGRIQRLDPEQRQTGLVRFAGHEDEQDDGRDDDDVPPDADLVEHRDEVDPPDVHHQLDEHEDAHGHELAIEDPRDDLRRVRERWSGQALDDRRVDEARSRVVDARDDGELADQVQPRGPPAPVLVLHPAGPVVQAAGRGVGRGDLGHRRGDGKHEDRDQRPAERHRGLARPGEAVVVEDDRAGQDADDREADREVAETAHRAEQLLRVAERMQVGDVLLDDVVARNVPGSSRTSLTTAEPSVGVADGRLGSDVPSMSDRARQQP